MVKEERIVLVHREFLTTVPYMLVVARKILIKLNAGWAATVETAQP